MKIYLQDNVFDAALDRIRWLYDNFPNVAVNTSGGKDSTVVFHLTLMVARERGRLPLDVMFVDQEAEWDATIRYMRWVMNHEDVRPWWLQVPIRISNATSPDEDWLYCWEEGKTWMREKEPNAVVDDVYGTKTFADMFAAWQRHHWPDEPHALIAGVRAEESPARAMGLGMYETWGGETWGRKGDVERGHYTWYPIYDWRMSDVWKAIHDNDWPYCSIYDSFYQYGVAPRNMRVSNVHHATALRSLFMLQEIEPETWDALTARLAGVNSAKHLNWSMFKPRELPKMFRTWVEYRDYLLDNLIVEPYRSKMRRQFALEDANYEHHPKSYNDLIQTEIAAILVNDYHGAKLSMFHASHLGFSRNRGKRSGRKLETDLVGRGQSGAPPAEGER